MFIYLLVPFEELVGDRPGDRPGRGFEAISGSGRQVNNGNDTDSDNHRKHDGIFNGGGPLLFRQKFSDSLELGSHEIHLLRLSGRQWFLINTKKICVIETLVRVPAYLLDFGSGR